jgi:putative ABC transport system permease protein
MLFALAAASLLRHRARTLLAVLGVAVSAAMLLDMVMLATGMRESFRTLLVSQGFQLRLAPKGTMPFDTEATIGGADSLVTMLRARPGVEAVSPVLGGQLHIPLANGQAVTSAALGIEPARERICASYPDATRTVCDSSTSRSSSAPPRCPSPRCAR